MMDATDEMNENVNSKIISLLKKVSKYVYIEAYGPDYDRSRDYEKDYNDRIKF